MTLKKAHEAYLGDPRELSKAKDQNSVVNLVNAWVADGCLIVSLNAQAFEGRKGFPEYAGWGLLLADIARHIGRSNSDPKMTDKVVQVMMEELKRPSAELTGGVV